MHRVKTEFAAGVSLTVITRPPARTKFSTDFRIRSCGVVSLIELIQNGEEGIVCLPPECAEVLIEQTMRRAGAEAANELYELYELGNQCQ